MNFFLSGRTKRNLISRTNCKQVEKKKTALSVNAEIASVQFSAQIHICNQQHFFFSLNVFHTFLKEILGKLEISVQKYFLVPCRKKQNKKTS